MICSIKLLMVILCYINILNIFNSMNVIHIFSFHVYLYIDYFSDSQPNIYGWPANKYFVLNLSDVLTLPWICIELIWILSPIFYFLCSNLAFLLYSSRVCKNRQAALSKQKMICSINDEMIIGNSNYISFFQIIFPK